MRTLLALSLALTLGFAAVPASAQELRQAPDPEAVADRLAEALDLTEAQQAIVEETLAGGMQPGLDWTLVAALEPTLTREQRATLLRPPEAREGRRAGPGRRRAGRRAGGDPEAREERAEAVAAARNAALGLTDEEGEALDEVLQTHRAELRAEAQASGEMPSPAVRAARLTMALAQVLTREQADLYLLHQGLARQAFAGRRGRR